MYIKYFHSLYPYIKYFNPLYMYILSTLRGFPPSWVKSPSCTTRYMESHEREEMFPGNVYTPVVHESRSDLFFPQGRPLHAQTEGVVAG